MNKQHYGARGYAAGHLFGTSQPLCGVASAVAVSTGHPSEVTCQRCKRLLAQDRIVMVNGRAETLLHAIDAGVQNR